MDVPPQRSADGSWHTPVTTRKSVGDIPSGSLESPCDWLPPLHEQDAVNSAKSKEEYVLRSRQTARPGTTTTIVTNKTGSSRPKTRGDLAFLQSSDATFGLTSVPTSRTVRKSGTLDAGSNIVFRSYIPVLTVDAIEAAAGKRIVDDCGSELYLADLTSAVAALSRPQLEALLNSEVFRAACKTLSISKDELLSECTTDEDTLEAMNDPLYWKRQQQRNTTLQLVLKTATLQEEIKHKAATLTAIACDAKASESTINLKADKQPVSTSTDLAEDSTVSSTDGRSQCLIIGGGVSDSTGGSAQQLLSNTLATQSTSTSLQPAFQLTMSTSASGFRPYTSTRSVSMTSSRRGTSPLPTMSLDKLKQVSERENAIQLEKKRKALERQRRVEEKLAQIAAQKAQHNLAMQQSRKQRVSTPAVLSSSSDRPQSQRGASYELLLLSDANTLRDAECAKEETLQQRQNRARAHNDVVMERKSMMVTQREMEHAVANNKVRAVEEKIATATANKEQQLQATQDSCNRRHRMWSIHVRNAAILQQTKQLEQERLAIEIQEKDRKIAALKASWEAYKLQQQQQAKQESVQRCDFIASRQRESARMPGPGDYIRPSEFGEQRHSTAPLFGASVATTIFDAVDTKSRQTPGPGAYNDDCDAHRPTTASRDHSAVVHHIPAAIFSKDTHTWITNVMQSQASS